jgi:DNA gyrase subunit A
VTKLGYGKRTEIEEYRLQGRGGVGTITQKVTDKVGEVVGVRLVTNKDQVMVTTDQGQSIRMRVSDISILGRNTQGVRLINLNEGEFVTGLALLGEDDGDDGETDAASTEKH